MEETKSYDDYSWFDLIDSGKLNKLKVKEPAKYLLGNHSSNAGKKADKVKGITAHYYYFTNNQVAEEMPSSSGRSSEILRER